MLSEHSGRETVVTLGLFSHDPNPLIVSHQARTLFVKTNYSCPLAFCVQTVEYLLLSDPLSWKKSTLGQCEGKKKMILSYPTQGRQGLS